MLFVNIIIILYLIIYICIFLLCYNISIKPIPKMLGYSDVPKVDFPFKNLFDDNGNRINVILISAPFRERKHEELYENYKSKGMKFAGISSYLEFPGKIINPHESRYHEAQGHNYESMTDTWLHCFREPDNYITDKSKPKILFTEADLKDTDAYKPNKNIKKEYDFMYVCLKDNDNCDPGWQSYNRNWELAKKCLTVMCGKYNLKGVIVGRENCPITELCSGIVKIIPFLEFNAFQKEMQKCRFLFISNVSDASPRVITEAICYDIPVLVNQNIVGGWHNVIPHVTGEFFSNEEDIIPALDYMTNNMDKYTPRQWFVSNRGKNISGVILSEFIINNYPDVNNKNTKYMTITI